MCIRDSCSHLDQIRGTQPLTSKSAFPFESFYSELRTAFVPGTKSPLKQMFESVLLKRILTPHSCLEKIYYSHKDTALECNSLVYCLEKNTYSMYKIISENNPITYTCFKQGRYPVKFNQTPALQWESVGVFELGGLGNNIIELPRERITGKVLKIGHYLILSLIHI